MSAPRICPICGTVFEPKPRSIARTCSEACRSELKRRSRTGNSRPWSQAARVRLSARGTPPQLALGTAAAMALPESRRGPQHRSAKCWHLLSPSGEEIVAVDLLEWARANRAAFGETDEEGARRIASGIRMLALGMRGKTKRANTSYKGWRLLAPPQGKTDCKEDPS